MDYFEPELSILVLDFVKPAETRACLESIKRYVKFPVKVIYLHNGPADYPYELYRAGLVDQFIQTQNNEGLGVGTRDLVGNCFSKYFMMLQNDQVIGRDFEQREFDSYVACFKSASLGGYIMSIGLAGHVAGHDIYSERCHLMETEFYKRIEHELPLSPGGAGPYHHQLWREGQIQEYYKQKCYRHFVSATPLVIDRGVWTIRDVAGGRVRMRTDTKAVYWDGAPLEKYIFPEMTDEEWDLAIASKWIGGTIPKAYLEKGQSFNCWGDQS